ncbi:hypothetical protein AMTR_s00001p00073530 [Amborella trichopoda]|uniref:Fe2OG dioxygenase domain-containing protein n=1 Tax=Amborella trichopoda TaxID=13333 RepID=W1NLQ5_AMBTC|nr:hypothetical protein AMTR_s00001p00073530 [Amborella trichopoda]
MQNLGLKPISKMEFRNGLGVTIDDEVIKAYIERTAVNLNYYPACPNPELTVGVGPHSDLGIITLLVQDDVGGLQAKIEDEWVEIAPTPGALVVNIGATLEVCPQCMDMLYGM